MTLYTVCIMFSILFGVTGVVIMFVHGISLPSSKGEPFKYYRGIILRNIGNTLIVLALPFFGNLFFKASFPVFITFLGIAILIAAFYFWYEVKGNLVLWNVDNSELSPLASPEDKSALPSVQDEPLVSYRLNRTQVELIKNALAIYINKVALFPSKDVILEYLRLQRVFDSNENYLMDDK